MAHPIERQCKSALATARLYIRQKGPYFSSVIYSFIPRMAPGLGTLGVTKNLVLIVDPEWYVAMEKEVPDTVTGSLQREKAADAMRAGVLVHEAMHVLRGMSRLDQLIKAGADPDLVNKAFDLPINEDLKKAGWSLPDWALYPSTFGFPEGLTGEQYYALMLTNQNKVEKVCKQLEGKGGGKGKGKDKGKGGGKNSSDSKGKSKGQVGAGKCGSCAGNSLGPIEESFGPDVGRSEADKNRVRKEGLRAIKEAASSGRGNVPGSLVEALNEKPERSVVPWERVLHMAIRATSGRIMCGQTDFSMRRPSRRSTTRGVIRPSMISRKPEVAFIEDVSGSMGKPQILSSRAEITGALRALGIPQAWYVGADTQFAHKPIRVTIRDIAKLPIYGRGGTNFVGPLAAIAKLNPKPDLVIYTTDGDGEAPEQAPKGMQVIWCIVPNSYGRRPAPWGKLVLVSNDQTLRDAYGM